LFNQEITIRLDEPADPLGLVTILKLTQVILKWLSPPSSQQKGGPYCPFKACE